MVPVYMDVEVVQVIILQPLCGVPTWITLISGVLQPVNGKLVLNLATLRHADVQLRSPDWADQLPAGAGLWVLD